MISDTINTIAGIVCEAKKLIGIGEDVEVVYSAVREACTRHGLDPIDVLRQIDQDEHVSVDNAVDRMIERRASTRGKA